MSANCSSDGCGHPIEAHGDRAVFPACEGPAWPPRPAYEERGSVEEGTRFWVVSRFTKQGVEACLCRGYQ